MKIIGIVANLAKPDALDQAEKIAGMVQGGGGTVINEKALGEAMGSAYPVFSLEKTPDEIEALIVLGGDGTMIRTFRKMDRKEVPLLGINLGGLGFLTEVRLDRSEEAILDLLVDNLQVQKRNTLEAHCLRDGNHLEKFPALNEIVIGKGGLARVIHMEAYVDNEYLTSYMADGIIIATPTGSTAYSLSALGPIICPDSNVFLINPICPHTLTNRPIILEANRSVKIKMLNAPEGTTLTVDGQLGLALLEGDEITVTKGDKELFLLTLPGMSFYRILRRKLKWGGRIHY